MILPGTTVTVDHEKERKVCEEELLPLLLLLLRSPPQLSSEFSARCSFSSVPYMDEPRWSIMEVHRFEGASRPLVFEVGACLWYWGRPSSRMRLVWGRSGLFPPTIITTIIDLWFLAEHSPGRLGFSILRGLPPFVFHDWPLPIYYVCASLQVM